MSQNNTVIRSMHDLGLAAWFGGQLMGAVGLNGAAAGAKDPVERLTLSSVGWAKWAPVQLAALAVHGVGGIGLILANRDRLGVQQGARTNTGVKLALTGAALVTTFWSASVGKKMAEHAREGAEGTTEPNADASDTLKAAQRQQKILQWATPVLTGVLLVMGAQQGEQQRSKAGMLDKWRR
ncbi:hypothetical protein [Curtobacterium sp. MCBD17_021]|uniref:hypothetical protein n=1 Tax=Curtobacterium sp. MCBD17_021 TaxID=2175665 RepID=UPI000DA98903|nr:hypothetical protein [Curtobacterium sp. MCBD17_021]PZE64055.1 hypothetical protein DEI83_12785 [Curtobacterium sp. MCBD17_021]